MRRIFGASVATVVGVAIVLATAGAATAATTGTVKTTPSTVTPWLLSSTANQNVSQLLPCGNLMYAVGKITAIGQGANTYTRSNAFSFSATTGAVTSWAPQVDGPVYSIALSPDCRTAYLGGKFATVGGVAAKNMVAVNASTGAVLTGFARNANNEVDTLQYTHGVVLAGGVFTWISGTAHTRLASLNPTTGAATPFVNLDVSGTYPGATTRIFNSQISHSGTRMLVEGVFTSLGGRARQQVAVLDLGSSSVSVDGWNAPEFDQACDKSWPFYAHAANWSVNDSTIYVATAGYKPPNRNGAGGMCDALGAFPATSSSVRHSWINYTGCDSYFGVVADTNNVYVTGHERWANNPQGCDAAGPGAVSRPGLGSISPSTGQATSWNPTRSLGKGGDDLVLTSAGLWVASDNWTDGSQQKCGHQGNHGGICFLPY